MRRDLRHLRPGRGKPAGQHPNLGCRGPSRRSGPAYHRNTEHPGRAAIDARRREAMSIPVETRQSILVLVELCYDMAEDDFGGEPRADHFFIDVLRVAEWLETQGLRTPKRAIPGPSIPPPCLET